MARILLKNSLFFRQSEWQNVNKQSVNKQSVVFHDFELQYIQQYKKMLLRKF